VIEENFIAILVPSTTP